MKIIFLDIDGVLNSQGWFNECLKNNIQIKASQDLDRSAVARLNKLIEATGAKVVVSSTWRLYFSIEQLEKILRNHGFTGEVIGKTRDLGTFRGVEIQDWLTTNGPVEDFAILDDDGAMVHLRHKLVQTDVRTGLLDHHIDRAEILLNRP